MPTHVVVYYAYCGFRFSKDEPRFRFDYMPIEHFNPDGYGVIYWLYV